MEFVKNLQYIYKRWALVHDLFRIKFLLRIICKQRAHRSRAFMMLMLWESCKDAILYIWTCIESLPSKQLALLLSFTFLMWYVTREMIYYKKLPPGPWGIPFLGYLPFLINTALPTWYLKMSARYGDIFSVKLGSNLVVCIGSAKLLKELFSRSDSIGRPRTPLNEIFEGCGIFISEGMLWKRQRQFLHEKFRALGVKLWPNLRFEKFIIMEVQELVHKLESIEGQPVDPTELIGRHVHNVICQLMMSFRFEENDEEFTRFNERVIRGMKLYGSVHIGEHVKHYLKLPGKKAVLDEIKRNLADISKFHADRITERVARRADGIKCDEPADLLDHYLDHIDKEKTCKEVTSIFPDTDTVKQIVQVMNDLFSAGMETTRTALSWSLVMMLREPAVAAKVRHELRQVLPSGHLVTLEHRSKLLYLEAVLLETLRRVSIVPLGTTHVNTSAWTIGDYRIPAGSHIVPLINKISLDPEIYPDPKIFNPERFIKNGQLYVPDSFVQFGTGQRICLGLQLARMEMFLFFANLMNSFDFSLAQADQLPGLDGVMGATHAPLPYILSFRKLE